MTPPYSLPTQLLCSNNLSAFRVENRSGRGFDLISSGPNAPNVPEEALTVDNNSPDIVFSDPSQWRRVDSVQYYRQGLSYTNVAGASLTYTFDGVAIWYDCVSHT